MLHKPAFGGLRNVTRAPTENERDVESHTHRAPRLRCPVLGIGAATEHVHVLARLAPTMRLADLAQRPKRASAFEARRHPRCPRPIVCLAEGLLGAQSLGIADLTDTLDYLRRQCARHDAAHRAEAWQHDLENF